LNATRGTAANAVAPGVIKSPMRAPATHEALAQIHPVGRTGEIQNVAAK
jgi:hypothetical protein